MRVGLAADHAGYELKDHLARYLAENGHAVTDFGTHSSDPVDYPDLAITASRAVRDGRVERGIVVCGSGAGAAIAANKVQDIRAASAHDTYTAHQAVEHDDANVLCLGSRVIGEKVAEELVDAFLGASFSAEDRHMRRVAKVKALEEGWR